MNTRQLIRGITRVFIIVSYLSYTVANAQPAQQSGERRGPPPEALEVCVDQTEGAACTFTSPRGEVTGSCIASPKGEEELVCAPEGGRPGGEHEN
ncbi:MAG: hypothetical protein KDI33_07740 [Halioglobus sp.]|nr:hypothetical protein [Halioglobus sp.]